MTLIELEILDIAHGGHCVARHEGRAVFVRHAIPGEKVVAQVTSGRQSDRFWRADAIDVLTPSEHRVEPAWADAGAGGIGAAEFQHITPQHQRELKRAVLQDAFSRFARVDITAAVAPAPGEDARGGWHWRTRIEVVGTPQERAGMHGHRSHAIHPLTSMPLAVPSVEQAALAAHVPAGTRAVIAAAGDAVAIQIDGDSPQPGKRRSVTHRVDAGGQRFEYRVPMGGFWQVHQTAPQVLIEEVLAQVGEATQVADLYGGVGLFAVPLGARGVAVVTVEGDERASRAARRNLHHLPHVKVVHGDVGTVLEGTDGLRSMVPNADVVIVDPPRSGIGRDIATALAATPASRIIYVACDPVALARDAATLIEQGFALTRVHGWDLFPMTHHLETIATFGR